MGVAVGTSLLVIAMKSFAGLAGYLASVEIDWAFAAAVTAAAVLGSLVGGRLAGRLHQDTLRTTFGWFVLVMAVLVLAQQLPAAWVWPALAVGWGLTGVAALAVRRRSRRRPLEPSTPEASGAATS
jgi:predicted MFS family arabinose efflux permease